MSLGREPRETPKGRSEGTPLGAPNCSLQSCLTECRASIRWHTPASGAPCSKHPAGGHIGASGREVNRRPAVIGRSAARRLKRSAASWTASRGTCWHTRPT